MQEYYSVDLVDMYRGLITPRRVSVLVLNAPRGARIHQYEGGTGAVTAETEGSWLVEHAVFLSIWQAGGKKGAEPRFRPYPEGRRAEQVKQEKKLSKLERAEERRLARNE